MHVVAEHSIFLHVFEGKRMSVARYDAFHQGAAEGGHAAGFPDEDMCTVVAEDGVGRGGEVCAERELVAHCARENEEGGGVSGEVCDVGFKGVSGGVRPEDVVEEGGVLDGVKHRGGGSCDDVACEGCVCQLMHEKHEGVKGAR